MSSNSIDLLQRGLADGVFSYARDSKKAAGRALGTLVEIITFYLIESWGFEENVAIERRLPEYANPEITHNVEFSLHPSRTLASVEADSSSLPLTSRKMRRLLGNLDWPNEGLKTTQLLSRNKITRNGCIVYEDSERIIISRLAKAVDARYLVNVQQLMPHPFAVMECKRVGVEEGVNKGPQTIEKAKQGAYVARTVSSLQKVRTREGTTFGVLYQGSGNFIYKPYDSFLHQIVQSGEKSLLGDFILTAGIVSNHGNWFTANDQNKELKVLAGAYDWLLFLTDYGLLEFIQDLILNPKGRNRVIGDAFAQSYGGARGSNRFTKVKMDLSADRALRRYFRANVSRVEGWFNVISPVGAEISEFKQLLGLLASKNWEGILDDSR